MDERHIRKFPRVACSLLPTPFQRLNRISDLLGINCYCKRDDLTGFALGGNKTRKLDFLIGDALSKKATAIVTSGAIQSNFCRMAAAAGRANGLEVHLVLGGRCPSNPTGNLLLDGLFGAVIHYIDTAEWQAWEQEAGRIGEILTSKGHNVYCLPIGGSTPIGALGYTVCLQELMADARKSDIEISRIIHASSSGGTQAGLVAGKSMTGWKGTIIGMGVAKTAEVLRKEIHAIAVQTGELLGTEINADDIIVDQRAMGSGYGARTPESDEAIRLFAESEGIVLDRVYTGKAAAGLLSMARQGEIGAGETVVFLHTGGSLELFS